MLPADPGLNWRSINKAYVIKTLKSSNTNVPVEIPLEAGGTGMYVVTKLLCQESSDANNFIKNVDKKNF